MSPVRASVSSSAAATSTSTIFRGNRLTVDSPQPLLDVRGVTLQYKTKDHLITATYRVDFQVFRSDRFVVLGPSGCGKSTLLKRSAAICSQSKGRSASRMK